MPITASRPTGSSAVGSRCICPPRLTCSRWQPRCCHSRAAACRTTTCSRTSPSTSASRCKASSLSAREVPSLTLSLRPVAPGDEAFLYRVYASTRAEEMQLVDWSDSDKHAFLWQQFTAQHTYYQQQYATASF